MLTLPETQQQFVDFVLREKDQSPILNGVKSNGLTAGQRLNIYRNNTQLGLTEVLRDGYPVVNKLVGAEFFNRMARDYIRHYPPTAGCLLFFGKEFAGFITGYPPAAGLPYLPDVARLEWLWHEAFHEADAPSLEIRALAQLNPGVYGQLSLSLHPTARLFVSGYPILRIWRTNQDGYEGGQAINLNEGGCRLLIFRPELEVEISALDETEFLFLNLLEQGLTLLQAVEQAIEKDAAFNVQVALHHWFAAGLFTAFSLKP